MPPTMAESPSVVNLVFDPIRRRGRVESVGRAWPAARDSVTPMIVRTAERAGDATRRGPGIGADAHRRRVPAPREQRGHRGMAA